MVSHKILNLLILFMIFLIVFMNQESLFQMKYKYKMFDLWEFLRMSRTNVCLIL